MWALLAYPFWPSVVLPLIQVNSGHVFNQRIPRRETLSTFGARTDFDFMGALHVIVHVPFAGYHFAAFLKRKINSENQLHSIINQK